MRAVSFGLLLAGCTFGGGPTIGVRLDDRPAGSPHGLHMRPAQRSRLVLGAEGEVGIGVLQLVAGFANRFGFARLDVSIDPIVVGSNNETDGFAARLGVGVGGGDGNGAGVAFATGLGGEHAFSDTEQCDKTHAFGVVTLDLRYQRGWQLVLAPRIAGVADVCVH